MKDFIYQNPFKMIFGKNGITEVISEIKKVGSKVMLVLDPSFKPCGFYVPFTESLSNAGIAYTDFEGIGYPSLARVREGIAICKKEDVDFVLGIGGGVCMDMAITIAFGTKQDYDIWDYLSWQRPTEGLTHLPVGTIVTNPMSGSEMNCDAQITNDETKEQCGTYVGYPYFTWLNPDYRMTLSNQMLAYNLITTFVQMSNFYLSLERCPVSEAMAAGLMSTLLDNLQKSIENPSDKRSRSNLMLCSALSVNGILSLGKTAEFCLYPLQALVQTYYEVKYPQAITILFPYWVKHIFKEG